MVQKVVLCGAMTALLAVTCVMRAGAQSPKVRQIMQREERALMPDVADTNRICDANITVKFDWTAAPVGELERADPGTARRYCDEALKSIRSVCSTRSDMTAVGTQIRRVVCGFRRFSGDPTISLNDGVLDCRINPARPSGAEVHAFLVDHLVVDGEPLSLRQAKRRDEERLANALKRTQQICGADISAKIDWVGVPQERIKSGDAVHCEHALDVMERICQDRPGQDAVRSQIKSFVCGYETKRSIILEEGVLVFKSDFASSDDVRVILVYLQNKL
jgi:hypothetical protein